MSLTTQIIAGSQTALSLIKTFLANPSISYSDGGLPVQIPATTVVLQCETYKETLDSDISQQVIVDINVGKQFISDNIAPKPRVWDMKGYIGVAPYELISSPVLQLSQAKALNWIREMRDSRQMLAFRTKNGQEIVLVGISNLVIDTDPMIQNRIPFTMTVKEVPILSYNKQGNLAIPSGTANVASLSSPMGTATVQTISLATANVAQTITDLILSIPVKGDRQVKNIFPIQIPQSGNGTYNFNFNAKCNGQVFVFNFKYTNVWNIAVTMSSGAIRTATLIPNVTQWSAYSDFSLYCQTDMISVGINDLANISLYLTEWK